MKFEITSKHVIIGSAIAAVAGVIGTVAFVISETNEMRRLRDQVEEKEDRLEKVLKKLDQSIDSMADNFETKIDISPVVIDDALDRAMKHVADTIAHEAVHEVYQDIKHMAQDQVTSVVDGIRPAAETEVRRQLQRQANNVRIQPLVKETVTNIAAKVEKDIRDEATAKVDQITSSFVDQVNQQAQFIKAMNAKMTN